MASPDSSGRPRAARAERRSVAGRRDQEGRRGALRIHVGRNVARAVWEQGGPAGGSGGSVTRRSLTGRRRRSTGTFHHGCFITDVGGRSSDRVSKRLGRVRRRARPGCCGRPADHVRSRSCVRTTLIEDTMPHATSVRANRGRPASVHCGRGRRGTRDEAPMRGRDPRRRRRRSRRAIALAGIARPLPKPCPGHRYFRRRHGPRRALAPRVACPRRARVVRSCESVRGPACVGTGRRRRFARLSRRVDRSCAAQRKRPVCLNPAQR